MTMVEECDEAFLKFDLDYDQVSGAQTKASYVCVMMHCQIWCFYCLLVLIITIWQVVVLETKTAKAATQDILTTHCIPSAVSEDLKSWGKLGAGCRLVQPKDPTILLGPGHLILSMNTSPGPQEMLKEFHCRWDSACWRVCKLECKPGCTKESIASITSHHIHSKGISIRLDGTLSHPES